MDHVVTDNINTSKDERNGAIKNDPKFDNNFNLSSRNKYSIPVVNFSLRGGKKHRATTFAGIKRL